MKIYIDDNDIGKTVSYKEADGVRQYLYVHDKEGFVIKHLAEHDKEIRNQVCERMRKFAYNTYKQFGCFDETDLEHILDKIEGSEEWLKKKDYKS